MKRGATSVVDAFCTACVSLVSCTGSGIDEPLVAPQAHDDRMPQLRTILAARDGIARGTELATYGWSRKRLSAAVHQQAIIRVRPGVFASRDAHEDVVIAAAHGGAVTCARALRLHRVWVLDVQDEHVHVWLGQGNRAHTHSGCHCVPHYRPGRLLLGIAPLEDALVHAFACHGSEFFFVAFESAWNLRLLSASARQRIRTALPRDARWLVDFARGDAQSGLESLLRLRLHLLGIAVQPQVEIGGVGRVDMVIEGCLILEADGRANHESAPKRHRDLVRDAAASQRGYETLRFDYAQIVHEWDAVVAAIIAAIVRARRG